MLSWKPDKRKKLSEKRGRKKKLSWKWDKRNKLREKRLRKKKTEQEGKNNGNETSEYDSDLDKIPSQEVIDKNGSEEVIDTEKGDEENGQGQAGDGNSGNQENKGEDSIENEDSDANGEDIDEEDSDKEDSSEEEEEQVDNESEDVGQENEGYDVELMVVVDDGDTDDSLVPVLDEQDEAERKLLDWITFPWLFIYGYDRFPLCSKLLRELLNGILISILIWFKWRTLRK